MTIDLKWKLILVLIIFMLVLVSCEGNRPNADFDDQKVRGDGLEPAPVTEPVPASEPENTEPEPIPEPEPEPEPPVEIWISAVGDVMVHTPQLTAQRLPDGTYDFHNNFQFIKPLLARSHLNIANLETTFGGPDRGFDGYPMFNTPDELAEALKTAGFSIISTVNNHTMDTGGAGMLRTLEVLKSAGLQSIGTRSSEDEISWVIQDVEGIGVGLTAYSYETPMIGNRRSLNGLPISTELNAFVDGFLESRLDDDLLAMEARIQEMRAAGAEFIIFVMHWGNEYQRSPSALQQKLALNLTERGVNLIIGSHPHVVQPIDWLTSKTQNGEIYEALVAYSLGNFISNQREQYLGTPLTEDGLMLHVKLQRDAVGEPVYITEVQYTPTWVHRWRNQSTGRNVYDILPLVDLETNREQFGLHSDAMFNRALRSKETTVNWIVQHMPEHPVSLNLFDIK